MVCILSWFWDEERGGTKIIEYIDKDSREYMQHIEIPRMIKRRSLNSRAKGELWYCISHATHEMIQ